MNKLTSLIRRAPKRFSATVAILAAAVIVPAVAFAWGPDRPTYTVERPADHVTFNSITNNPNVGDERNFVVVKDAANTANGGWQDNVTVEPGKEYLVRVYVHNNAASSLNLKALNTRVMASVPNTTGKNVSVSGFVTADNAEPQKIWDDIHFNSSQDFNLTYVAGSAEIYNNGYAAGGSGKSLSDNIVTSTGALIGYEGANGEVPGCFQYANYVYFKVKPQFPKESFTVAKDVRKSGETNFVESVNAKSGDKLNYRITYKNTGNVQQNNVVLKDKLPAGISYVPGTVKILNANNPSGAYVQDGDKLFSTGINIGSYTAGSNALVIFDATVNKSEDLPACGPNTLKNIASAQPYGQTPKEDGANAVVDKTCKPPTVKYTCDSLEVKKLTSTSVRFTTKYTVENATFKNITYVIRNASGTEIDRKVSTSATLDYIQTTPGKYTVEALLTVTVGGYDKTAPVGNCKGAFEIEKKVVVKYSCNALEVKKLTSTSVRFTTGYTVENATFKSVTYTVRNAAGTVVDTKVVTNGTAYDYTQTTPGNYTVQAAVTFTVNGEDKTVTDPKCKGAFEIEKKVVVKYTCDALDVKSISRTEFTFATAYTVENATFKSITYVVRNAAGTVVDTITATTNSTKYTQTQAGNYTVQATVSFTVNGETKTATNDNCKDSFKVKDLPKEITVCELATKKIVTIKESDFNTSKYSKNLDDCKTPETMEVCVIATKETKTINKSDFDAAKYTTDFSKCEDTPVTPPELPQTGTGENIVALLGLGALIASIAYYVASRRALNQ